MTRSELHRIKTEQRTAIKITRRNWNNANTERRNIKRCLGLFYGKRFRSAEKARRYHYRACAFNYRFIDF